jgi:8-oxo-dGTP pyrophosphatase MutT (NUDIX family)
MPLRLECDERLRAAIRAQLADFPHERAAGEGRAAAVAVAIADEGHGANLSGLPNHDLWQSRAALLLTRRSSKLRNHAGQWAFPGGRVDVGESAEETALREMREEIGLALTADAVIGRLDDFVTRSGFVITPIVIWAGPQPRLEPNEHEVASIHRIPIAELLREDAPLLDPGPDAGRPVLRMPIGSDWIAAPTAAILYQFREVCVLGRRTRVGHFDQPAFAWR